MTISLKHATEAVGVEAGNGEIGKTEWNEEHTLTAGAGKIVGRYSGTDGAVQEITPSTGLTLNSTTGNLTVDFSNYAALAGAVFTGTVRAPDYLVGGTDLALTRSTTSTLKVTDGSTGLGALTAGTITGSLLKIDEGGTTDAHVIGRLEVGYAYSGNPYISISGAGTKIIWYKSIEFQISGGASFSATSTTSGPLKFEHNRASETISFQTSAVSGSPVERLNIGTTKITSTLPVVLPSYTVATLPSAATIGAGAIAYCTDETGGAIPVFSDGTNWRRMTDRAVAA